jgi:hypothetical protein
MFENIKKILQQETLTERSQRMIPAAIYGAIIGTAYTLALSLVNVYSFPGLPIGIDWKQMLGMWLGYSLALALFGTIAAWFTEEYAGIVGGGVIITILLAIFFLITSGASNSTLTLQSIITALPLIGVAMLVALGLRWTARRHLEIVHGEVSQRRKLLPRHVLIIILVGLIPGIFNRMDLPAQQSLTQLHELLQAAPNDPSVLPHLPLRQVPALKDHFGVDYLLYPSRSVLAAGSLDVTIKFSDGFTMTCVLPVNTGANFITDCVEGDG